MNRGVWAFLLSYGLVTSSALAEEPAQPTPEDLEQARSDYNRDLLGVEEEVKHLKERVFRSKATLQLLRELVLEGVSAGSQVQIRHVNKLGNVYSIEAIQYWLDGQSIYNRTDPGGALNGIKDEELYQQQLPTGAHDLDVQLMLRGKGFGVFTYLRTYQFKLESSYSFSVKDGEQKAITAVVDERKGVKRSFEDKPGVAYEERVGGTGEK